MNRSGKDNGDVEFRSKVHKYGIITTTVLILMFFTLPLLLMLILDVKLDWAGTFRGIAAGIISFGPVAVTEFISYAPIMGAGGLYLAFTTGNISSMKLPAASNALKICNIQGGDEAAEPISMIAIGISSIVTTVILVLGMALSAQMLPILENPSLAPAFNNVLTAIVWAMATPIFVKDLKTSSVPVMIAALATLIFGYTVIASVQTYLYPVFIILALTWSYFLYKRKNAN